MNYSDVIPSLSLEKNMIDSIKLGIINLVYLIPILIIWFVSAYLLNFFNLINDGTSYFTTYGPNYLNYIPDDLKFNVGIVVLIMGFLTIVLFLIYLIFTFIVEARLAKYNKFKSAFQIREIINDISNIGWGKYLIWFFLFLIIVGILSAIYATICMFGVFGVIIASFFIYTFLQFFRARKYWSNLSRRVK